MKSMSYIVLLLIFVSCNKKIDTLILESKSSVEIESRVPQFPDDWLGYWSGDIDIYNEKGMTMTVPMALDHAVTPKDSVWTWAIIYGEDTIAGRRDYELNIVDSTKGHEDTIQDEEDIPIVYSYKNTVYQKARLKKGR